MRGTVKSIDAEPLEQTSGGSRVFQDGVVAGVIGAATVALRFLVLDTLNGRPLHTPTVLGTALFRHGKGLASPASLPISLDTAVLVANLLAAATMGGYFRLRHPHMRISP